MYARPSSESTEKRTGGAVHRALLCPLTELQALREREEPRRGLVAESPRAEVDADPDLTLFVLHEVDVVVARSHRPELRLRERRELSLGRKLRRPDLLQHRVVDTFTCRNPHAERDPTGDLAHDLPDAAELLEVGPRQLRSRGLVAAADVVPDARRRDVALVCDTSTDGLRVAGMVVGAEHAELGVAGPHAAFELLETSLVDDPEGLDVHVSPPSRRMPYQAGLRARTIAPCMPSATACVNSTRTSTSPALSSPLRYSDTDSAPAMQPT